MIRNALELLSLGFRSTTSTKWLRKSMPGAIVPPASRHAARHGPCSSPTPSSATRGRPAGFRFSGHATSRSFQLRIVLSASAKLPIEKGDGLVEVVEHGRMPREEPAQHGLREHLRHHDAVAVVVVRRVPSPVDQVGADVVVRPAVAVDVYHAVALV